MNRIQRVAAWIFTDLSLTVGAQAADLVIREFDKQELTPIYWSEGADFGDFNKDGHLDIVSGPNIFLGPDFNNMYEYYPAVAPTRRNPTDRSYYSNDNFFSFVFDFNADGWPDVLTVGLPNTEAYWYQNPASHLVVRLRTSRTTGSATLSQTVLRTKHPTLATLPAMGCLNC